MPVLEPKTTKPVIVDASFEAGFEKVFAPFPNTPAKPAAKPAFSSASQPAHTTTPAAAPAQEPQAPDSQKALTESRTKGFEEGYAKGFKDARSEADERNTRIERTVNSLSQALNNVLQERRFDDVRKAEEVAEIVLRIARKVAGSALTENPVPEIEKVVKKSFEILFNEPYLVVYVHSTVLEDVAKKIESITRTEGFRGTVEVKAKDSLSDGSCELQWEGGGLKSDKDAIWKEISQVCDMPKDVFDA